MPKNIYLVNCRVCASGSRREVMAKHCASESEVNFVCGWEWGRRVITQQKRTLTLGPLQVKFFDLPKLNLNVNLYRVGNRLALGNNMKQVRQRYATRDVKFLIGWQSNRREYPTNHGDPAICFGSLQIAIPRVLMR